jgi:hypothetical protein
VLSKKGLVCARPFLFALHANTSGSLQESCAASPERTHLYPTRFTDCLAMTVNWRSRESSVIKSIQCNVKKKEQRMTLRMTKIKAAGFQQPL